MPYQNIDATISPADVQAVKDSFAAILGKLPFLINLTANERKGLVKTGPDSISFVQNASVAAQNNTAIFPASFNRAEVIPRKDSTEESYYAAKYDCLSI